MIKKQKEAVVAAQHKEISVEVTKLEEIELPKSGVKLASKKSTE